MPSQLNWNVSGNPGTDQPTLIADNPPGGTTLETRFEGVEGQPPNRFVAIVPGHITGGATLTYDYGRKSVRVIVPPGEGSWEAGAPPCLPPELQPEDMALVYGPAWTMAGRVSAEGRHLKAAGQRLRWRGITAFRAIQRLSVGDVAGVERFLDFCAEHRAFPRVLAMLGWQASPLDPAVGRRYLPVLLEMARIRGLYVEVVALADTKTYPGLDFDQHVSAIGSMCAEAGNAIVEVGNELLPIHSTQSDRLTPPMCLRLARFVQSSVPVSVGSTHGPEHESEEFARLARQLPNGYATAHDTRTEAEDGWKKVRHPNDLAWIADGVGIDLLNDEPWKLDLTPGRHLGTAFLCHGIRDIGDCFHSDAGLHAEAPTGPVLEAFLARKQGWDLADGWQGTYKNAGFVGSPVKSFSGGLRCYSSVNGDAGFTLGLDADRMQIDWNEGWHPLLIASRDGAKVFRLTRS